MWLFSPESVLFTNTFLCCSISIPYKQLLEMQIYFSKCNCVLQTTRVLLTMTNVSWARLTETAALGGRCVCGISLGKENTENYAKSIPYTPKTTHLPLLPTVKTNTYTQRKSLQHGTPL